MGASQVPATSNGAPITSWVQLATSSPTSGSAVSFTSLSAYKQYRIIIGNLNVAAGSPALSMTLNNTASNYSTAAGSYNSGGSFYANYGLNNTSSISINSGTFNQSYYGFTSEILIDFSNQSTPKSIRYSMASSVIATNSYVDAWAIWDNTATVNRIDFSLTSSTFTSGTITVFGSN
jgi:hypothetical protein